MSILFLVHLWAPFPLTVLPLGSAAWSAAGCISAGAAFVAQKNPFSAVAKLGLLSYLTAVNSPMLHILLLPLRGLVLLALLASLSPVALADPLPWQTLEKGLEYAEFDREDQSQSTVVVLRFDPAVFVFSLHMVSEGGGAPKTLRQWAESHDLVAAINASMYLPDGSTSTGFMRNGTHTNNRRIGGRFGVFFVAEPDDPSLPPVALLDKETEGWEQRLPHYKVVVQNYRMINARRNILWSPGGPLYSISAVGQDGGGNILFIHCREPIDAYSFASLLLHLPLDVRTVMYVEGGAQAGLALRTQGYSLSWGGRHPADFLVTGNVNAALPNVLGVKRRLPSASKDANASE